MMRGNVLAQKKIRVHELSKELGLTSKELLDFFMNLFKVRRQARELRRDVNASPTTISALPAPQEP